MKRETQIEVLMVEPGKRPYRTTIDNTLEAMQQKVGGLIECIVLDPESVLVCNDEGKLIGMEGNRRLGSDIIAGPFFIAGDDGEAFQSLPKEKLEQYEKQFETPETFTAEEVQATCRMHFFSFDSY